MDSSRDDRYRNIIGSRRTLENQQRLFRKVKRLESQGVTGARPLMNYKKELFCQEYMIDQNQTASLERAGLSPNTYPDLTGDPSIIMRLAYLQERRALRTGVMQDKVIHELSDIAFSNIMDFIEVDSDGKGIKIRTDLEKWDKLGLPANVIQTISSTDKTGAVTITLHDKIRSIDMLMKHMNMYNTAERELERQKFEFERSLKDPAEFEIEDDGFLEAMGVFNGKDIGIEAEVEKGHIPEEDGE